MRVLGVDPGSRYLGYGLVEASRSGPRHLAHGVIRAGSAAPLAERLEVLFLELGRIIDVFAPAAMAVEGVFTHKNARSALVLGHARGVVLLLAARARVPVFEYAPARVKRSVGAGGNDSKASVERMVRRLLRLEGSLERADAADALAVACCHANQAGPFRSRPVARRSAATAFTARLAPNVVRPRPTVGVRAAAPGDLEL